MDYQHEVGKPEIPICQLSPFKLYFNGEHLMATGAWANSGYIAVSGKPDKDGKFDYSTERQKLSGIGPIPAGEYWINPSEIWQNTLVKNCYIPLTVKYL